MTERFQSLFPAAWARPGAWDSPDTAPQPAVEEPSFCGSPPERPPSWQERVGHRLLLVLSPRLARQRPPDPPNAFKPFSRFEIERSGASGRLSALWYPALGEPRGAVLLIHPWLEWGQSYFYRRGRVPALRRAGYHVLSFDLGGFGHSGPAPRGFFDQDLRDALDALRQRAQGLPLHLWGVSAGGYWAHPLLSHAGGVSGAFFEDVSPHLIEWSKRMAPWGMPFYLFYQRCLAGAYRFLDLRRHAPCLRVRRTAYVSGELDRGVTPEATRELSRLAGATHHIIEGAEHLQAMRTAPRLVVRLALDTFEQALA